MYRSQHTPLQYHVKWLKSVITLLIRWTMKNKHSRVWSLRQNSAHLGFLRKWKPCCPLWSQGDATGCLPLGPGGRQLVSRTIAIVTKSGEGLQITVSRFLNTDRNYRKCFIKIPRSCTFVHLTVQLSTEQQPYNCVQCVLFCWHLVFAC